MKKRLLKNVFAATLVAVSVPIFAQQNSEQIVKMKLDHKNTELAKPMQMLSKSGVCNVVQKNGFLKAAPKVNYDLPDYLSIDAMPPKGHFLSYNVAYNNYLMLLPKDSVVTFYDTSENGPTSWLWDAMGGEASVLNSQDLNVVYRNEADYSCPTLTVTNGDGTSGPASFKPKLIVGKKAEIFPFNTLELNATYGLGAWKLEDGSSLYGASNNVNTGLANLLFLAKDEATIESVSVYIEAYPVSVNSEHKVKLGLYYPTMVDGKFVLLGEEIATATLKVSEMMAAASSITGIKYTDGTEAMGMANFKFPTPVKIEGSLVTIAITDMPQNFDGGDRFSVYADPFNDKIADDAYIVDIRSWVNALLNDGTYGWLESGAYFKDANPVFHMAPVVNFSTGSQGLEGDVVVGANNAYVSNGVIVLDYKEANNVSIYNLMGQAVYAAQLNGEGQTTASVAGNGAFIVKFTSANGNVQTVKVIK